MNTSIIVKGITIKRNILFKSGPYALNVSYQIYKAFEIN